MMIRNVSVLNRLLKKLKMKQIKLLHQLYSKLESLKEPLKKKRVVNDKRQEVLKAIANIPSEILVFIPVCPL